MARLLLLSPGFYAILLHSVLVRDQTGSDRGFFGPDQSRPDRGVGSSIPNHVYGVGFTLTLTTEYFN
jgi:hypothetical protein